MTRSRKSAKSAGSRFERLIADCLAQHIDDRIDRRVKTGSSDKGDVGGVRTVDGRRVVLELKDYGGRTDVGTWLREAESERINDGAQVGAVVFKRRGLADPLDQGVLMTVRDLVALLTTERPV